MKPAGTIRLAVLGFFIARGSGAPMSNEGTLTGVQKIPQLPTNMTDVEAIPSSYQLNYKSIRCGILNQVFTPESAYIAGIELSSIISAGQKYVYGEAVGIAAGAACRADNGGPDYPCYIVMQLVMNKGLGSVVGDIVNAECGSFVTKIYDECGSQASAIDIGFNLNGVQQSDGTLYMTGLTGTTCANLNPLNHPYECSIN